MNTTPASALGAGVQSAASLDADLERRFGGLRRLYGDRDYASLRALRVAVVGVGGVGSWAVEALARSGVAALTLIDMDHVAESNINRQIQALDDTLGMAKIEALASRIARIHPGCDVTRVDAFVEPQTWPALLPSPVDALVDACDQPRAKHALARWALASGTPFVSCGAAGGKRDASAVAIADLAEVTHDPLLAAMRQRLRRELGVRPPKRFGLRCVYARESVARPLAAMSAEIGDDDASCAVDGTLNCAGYGSSVMVTASFGMAAAAEAVRLALHAAASGHATVNL